MYRPVNCTQLDNQSMGCLHHAAPRKFFGGLPTCILINKPKDKRILWDCALQDKYERQQKCPSKMKHAS